MLTNTEKARLEKARQLVIQAKAIIDELMTTKERDDEEQDHFVLSNVDDECYSVIVSIDNVISES